jgi:predicted transcriptional regulator
MARSANPHPTDGELEILRALWDREAATLGDVCESLRRERDVATTTVATMLGVMLEKGLVRRKKAARGYQWSAGVSRAAAAKGMVGKLVDSVFDGSAGRLVSHLVEGGKLSASELAELRTLIDLNANNSSRKGAKAPRS